MSHADIWLVSEEIRRVTGLEAAVVSGAMTARGLAKGEFTEVTLGTISEQAAEEVKKLLEASPKYVATNWGQYLWKMS